MTPADVLAELPVAPDRSRSTSSAGWAATGRARRLISRFARGWTLDRMPVIDRAVLRMGAFELLHRPDVPTGAVISEAVELAKRYSTDDSGRFVNGVLASIAAAVRPQPC